MRYTHVTNALQMCYTYVTNALQIVTYKCIYLSFSRRLNNILNKYELMYAYPTSYTMVWHKVHMISFQVFTSCGTMKEETSIHTTSFVKSYKEFASEMMTDSDGARCSSSSFVEPFETSIWALESLYESLIYESLEINSYVNMILIRPYEHELDSGTKGFYPY